MARTACKKRISPLDLAQTNESKGGGLVAWVSFRVAQDSTAPSLTGFMNLDSALEDWVMQVRLVWAEPNAGLSCVGSWRAVLLKQSLSETRDCIYAFRLSLARSCGRTLHGMTGMG